MKDKSFIRSFFIICFSFRCFILARNTLMSVYRKKAQRLSAD